MIVNIIFKYHIKRKNKKQKINLIKFIYKLFFILNIFLCFIISEKKNYINYNEKPIINNINNVNKKNKLDFNKNCLYEYLNNSEYFRITFMKYSFSFKYKMIKMEYNIGFYDKNNSLILPSNLALYKNLHIICNIITKDKKSIDSLANIYKNKYFNCIEFCKINENIKFGIKIYQINEKIKYLSIYFFTEKIFSFNNLYYNLDNIFEPLLINNEYISFSKIMIKKEINKNLRLKKSYMKYPYCSLKRESTKLEVKWVFNNIYNNYFCLCVGYECLSNNSIESCKYSYYLYIIDNNKSIYKKTEYLFFDFIFEELSSDDVYPIFQKMLEQKFPVHYLTEKKYLYNKYCKNIKECLIILPVLKESKPINGNFLEKYLTLFLKIKVVSTGRGTTFNTNLFYNIDYITYISVGHGVCYFKYFLYNENRIYGKNKNNKILLPPSEKIILIAKKYGWEDKDIIRINLPRWEKYNSNNNPKLISYKKINKNSIFIMFTWRHIKKNKKISYYYLENILKLIYNDILNYNLRKKKMTLYLSFHRLIDINYIKHIKKKMILLKYIKLIEQNEISECLSKSSLVVSDFSSIIFDFIYRGKPFIIFIPDGEDPQLKEIYKNDYYELIKSLKNGTIYFENKYFYINETVNKIIYYINNNFKLDSKLKLFYDSFGFKKQNSIDKFIYYLENLK